MVSRVLFVYNVVYQVIHLIAFLISCQVGLPAFNFEQLAQNRTAFDFIGAFYGIKYMVLCN